jgi:hypothetical protein
MNCEFCGNEFSSNNSLKAHQKRAKYCLDKQKESKPNFEVNYFICQWCNKEFTKNYDAKIHEQSCKLNRLVNLKYDIECLKNEHLKELKEKDKQLVELQNENERKIVELQNENERKIVELQKEKDKRIELEKECIKLKALLKGKEELSDEFKSLHSKKDNFIEKIAMQHKVTTKTNNTNNQNILNNLPVFTITTEQIEAAAEFGFTRELFLQGQTGVAKFFINFVKEIYGDVIPWTVTDRSRCTFKIKDENGNIITDPKAEKITEMVANAIKKKNKEHHDSFYPKIKDLKGSDSSENEMTNSDDSDIEDDVKALINHEKKVEADENFISITKLKNNNKWFRNRLMKEFQYGI